MAMVLHNWHRPPLDRRLSPAVRETVAFLWLLVLLAALVLVGLGVATWLGHSKEHRHHWSRAMGLIERAHGLELQAARQEGDEAHAADGAGQAGGSA